MLRNYLKIAYRNLLKNKVFSLINVFGLAIGMAACLLIIHYVRFELSYENFHKNADNIYRVTLDLYKGSEYVVTDCETYGPLGPMLKSEMPEVVDFVRMFHNEVREVKVGEKKFFEERIYFADSSAFTVFSYEVLSGNPEIALSAPHQTVITASTAKKYFGHTDVVGETMEIANVPYQVSAVIADLPPNTHLKYDFLLSHVTINKMWDWYEDNAWNGNNEYTYLLMTPGTDLDSFNEKLTQLSIDLKEKIGDERFTAEPINDIHLYSHKTFEPEVNGNAEVVYFLLIIALFIIIIAWVNYVNLSTARAVERAREVGIRKVMGSGRGQLVTQFLLESVMVSLLAAGIAITILQISLPAFRDITGQPLPLNLIADSVFWYMLLGLVSVGTVISGLYPAFVLSSFKSTLVLKGKLRSSSHGHWLRKGLVVFQFAATVVLIACTGTVYLQINHLRHQDLGMDIHQTMAMHAPSLDLPDSVYQEKIQSLKTELLRHTEVKRIAISESLPGLSLHELSTNSGIRRLGEDKQEGTYNYYLISIDADFIPTLDMQIIAGRNFEPGMPNHDQVMINEEAVRTLGFASVEEALGSRLNYKTRWPDGEPSTIIGVIKNYNQRSPKEAHLPMIFPYTASGGYLTLRLNTQEIRETVNAVENTWQQIFPASAFDYFFLDEKYDQQYRADTQFGQVVAIFSTLAIFIACLGLFGLSSFTILQRTKEIGIRKVLGASVTQIVRLLSQDFIRLVLIASVLAIPIAWFAMNEWLAGYATRISLQWWLFALPLGVVLLIALLTVGFQTVRAALANPAKSLRYE